MDLWYNEPMIMIAALPNGKGSLESAAAALVAMKISACCILPEKSVNSTTEFVEMVVESQ